MNTDGGNEAKHCRTTFDENHAKAEPRDKLSPHDGPDRFRLERETKAYQNVCNRHCRH